MRGFLVRQKANFLRPPDSRGSVWSLVVGILAVVIGGLVGLGGLIDFLDGTLYLAIWLPVIGAAIVSMGMAGRLPAGYYWLTVTLRTVSVTLLLTAFALFIIGWGSGRIGPVPEPSLGSLVTLVGYTFFAFLSPLGALLGYGLGSDVRNQG